MPGPSCSHPLSDRFRRRVPFILLALAGAIPGLIGVTFATEYWLLLASSFVLGAFLLSSGPLAFQCGVELTVPAPEGTSNGLLLLAGQVSGIAFILGMDALKAPTTGMRSLSLLVLTGLMGLPLLLATRLKESAALSDSAE